MTPISNKEKRERLNRLSEEQWLRWAYVPFCIAEGAWDYADTVVDIVAQMKLSGLKPQCRRIRELKRAYDGLRQRHAMTSSGNELRNFIVVEESSGESFRYMRDCIRNAIRRQLPELDAERATLLIAVYSCQYVLEILFKYMKAQEAIVCDICGFSYVSSILPKELRELKGLLPAFIGDTPIKIKGCGLFVHNIVKGLCRVKLTDCKEDADLL